MNAHCLLAPGEESRPETVKAPLSECRSLLCECWVSGLHHGAESLAVSSSQLFLRISSHNTVPCRIMQMKLWHVLGLLFLREYSVPLPSWGTELIWKLPLIGRALKGHSIRARMIATQRHSLLIVYWYRTRWEYCCLIYISFITTAVVDVSGLFQIVCLTNWQLLPSCACSRLLLLLRPRYCIVSCKYEFTITQIL